MFILYTDTYKSVHLLYTYDIHVHLPVIFGISIDENDSDDRDDVISPSDLRTIRKTSIYITDLMKWTLSIR